MKRVLILCTGNSCRSQMAEAIWRDLGEGQWEAHSAGSHPTGEVHPIALWALERDGLSVDALRSKSVQEYSEERFDEVITVCDSAAEACPVFPGAAARHWPFPDPAHFEGSLPSRRQQFAKVRDDIRVRVAQHLAAEYRGSVYGRPTLADQLRTWLGQRLDQLPWLEAKTQSEYEQFVDRLTAEPLDDAKCWSTIPSHIHAVFGHRGWAWNGIYLRAASDGSDPSLVERLVLKAAYGPPVCSELERRGGVGSSGMCFDAVLTGQALVADRVKDWQGYHSCDAESGLATRSGLVVPIRDRGGAVQGVWDLDSTEPLDPNDLSFFDAVFGALGASLPHGVEALWR